MPKLVSWYLKSCMRKWYGRSEEDFAVTIETFL